ncbi:hypothetical protein L5515_009383 [Caenorhabditis briggsae]|uniref:Uncharacterized protein n=1 Tax=Caenorhabditis briggsae TaxID=6238 RepID=A0AAE9F9S8_CAEBR|nr:hypothetical protein L5515_009383 [Caenorhabditis briggsae]
MEYESSARPPTTQAKISVMSLVTHIETIAMYYDLDSLQNKASLAIGKMNDFGENKTLSVKKFNSLIDSLLICIEENRIRRNETSIPLKSLLKHLQLYLIRPLRSEEALESISQKIQEIGDNNDEVPPTLIGEILNFLLISTGFCAQFDEYYACLRKKDKHNESGIMLPSGIMSIIWNNAFLVFPLCFDVFCPFLPSL